MNNLQKRIELEALICEREKFVCLAEFLKSQDIPPGTVVDSLEKVANKMRALNEPKAGNIDIVKRLLDALNWQLFECNYSLSTEANQRMLISRAGLVYDQASQKYVISESKK